MYVRYPDMLEEMLNAAESGRYEVWNWSVGGFGLPDYARILESRALRHRPELIILGLCLNDLDQTPVIFKDPQGVFHCYRPFRLFDGRLDNLLYGRSYLYRMVVSLLERPARRHEDWLAQRREGGRLALARIRRLAADQGVPVLAFVFPYLKPWAAYGDEEREEWRDIRALLDEQRIDYVDLAAHLPEKERARWRAAPQDTVHLNPAGCRLVAEVMRRELRSRNLLSPRRKSS
jgi:lysophospholipase L1-like esterase